ncbi:sensor histidine kinase [Usitatibacter palustris]|uniref:Histidine kinase/HSP90-like ATPase domain-containing protein n=1 Tax=Usitatibacter palustris TaxID=2732487 RepID=A0A6M4HB59_9PROT|nr:histidine kinase [Usitatibacter palustris]QJR15873.1 hypothetical protein DSM104440_02699 [Usitatibacter palustris]
MSNRKSFFFVARLAFAWAGSFLIVWILLSNITKRWSGPPSWVFVIGFFGCIAWTIAAGISHQRRVRLIAGEEADGAAMSTRHRREIQFPLDPSEAFSLIEATIRELPRVSDIEADRNSLEVRAKVKRRPESEDWPSSMCDRVIAIVAPGESTTRVTLVCEPTAGPWIDLWFVDYGANLGNMAAITRGMTRRVTERMHQQQVAAKQAEVEKELAVAKLSLLEAQVEPHFLYNTLASAQILTRTDPARADNMLGHLIEYLRRAVPRADETSSTLGEELERAKAYLEILRIRMGERLKLNLEVPEELKSVKMPAMMLQTLVENAIKHGLEPIPGGGSVWIIARSRGNDASITVADDGRGFGGDSAGTGIGLRNIRERLRLAYGDAASFAITSNFPKGVAATITVPLDPPDAKA